MRKTDIPLRHMIDIVAICIILHNMCTIGNDTFDMEWIEETERKLNKHIDNKFLREG